MIPEIKPEATPEVTTGTSDAVEPPPEITPAVPPVVVPKTRWQRFLHWEFLGLAIIVLVTLIFHFIAIMRPPTIVWDEVWYVGDARSIISGTGELRPEHPPLAKLSLWQGNTFSMDSRLPNMIPGPKIAYMIGSSDANDKVIVVSDASQFKVGANDQN